MLHGSHRRSPRTLRPRARRALLEALESRRLLTAVSIWNDQATPAVSGDPDNASIEVGVKFKSDVAGSITGLRFYKDATNTGIHDGHLWAADGTLLATVEFTNETASGWQTVQLGQPVEIQPNTTYVASYHTDVGHYSTTENGFSAGGVDNAPLHALGDGVDGGDGVYTYGADGSFPTQTFNATNYWVDVVFAPDTAPAAPTGLGATAASTSEIDLAWSDNATNEAGYRVERSTDGSTFTPLATLAANAASYADTGLTASTHYFYRVFAFNNVGDSGASNSSDATTLADAGNPPPSGTVTYLSDLPTTAEFNGLGPVERDMSVGGSGAGDGSTLKINGTTYQKGFGVNAYSELDFDLTGGNYTTFQTDIGIDDATHGQGSVTFQVLLDGVVAYDSGVVTGLTGPKHVSLNVTGVKQLVLAVTDGGDGITNDNADWGGAKLISGGDPTTGSGNSIWNDQATPAVASDPDSSPIEVGVKFRSDVAGLITGLRFYKGDANTGTHDGHLWAADGTLLASGTFTNETASGWQTLLFDQPVEIQPNTTYIASYHTDVGHYASTDKGFAQSGADSGPLHALADGVDGGNGVYMYGPDASFPTQSFDATNYWVDVVFAPDTTTPTGPAAPTGLAAATISSSEIDLAWSDNATNETGYRVERSTDGSTFITVATLGPDAFSYADTGLSAGTTYTYRVFAFNDNGDSGPSNTAHATTDTSQPVDTAPAAPGFLATVAVSSSEINIGWTDVADNETGYRVERSTDGTNFATIATLGPNTTSYVDLGLTASTHYFYRVFAFNAAGDSGPSNTADATTQGTVTPPPTGGGQLTGTPIGTAGSWGNGGNDISKAFDGSLDTFFDAPTDVASVGLDLGTPTVITSIAFAPRLYWSSRMVGGRFEASNDGSTWTTLYTITSAPPTKQLTTVAITDPTAYRYVRYTSPPDGWGNVAEIQFFGPGGTTTPPPTGGSGQLTGTVIGTAGSWGDSGNDASKAFDGNLDTFFDAPTDVASTGLDLGTPTVITSIAFAPRLYWSSRMVGGRFEASNDGTTWTTLYTITSAPTEKQLTTVAITDPTAYRFVRYTSPPDGWGNVAEIQFFGPGGTTTPPPPTGGTGQLTGTPIGTAGSWANSGNDISKAFDGNLDTFFDAPTDVASVGLDLGTPKVITSVQFAPRIYWSSRMVGGQFQGSNDGSTWTTLYTITSAPPTKQLTTVDITDPTAYRYVRYISPPDGWGNLSEVEFFGIL